MYRVIKAEYIPDITDRYPEGYRSSSTEEMSAGHEPSYAELCETDPYYIAYIDGYTYANNLSDDQLVSEINNFKDPYADNHKSNEDQIKLSGYQDGIWENYDSRHINQSDVDDWLDDLEEIKLVSL